MLSFFLSDFLPKRIQCCCRQNRGRLLVVCRKKYPLTAAKCLPNSSVFVTDGLGDIVSELLRESTKVSENNISKDTAGKCCSHFVTKASKCA
jgi:hypothetical protein